MLKLNKIQINIFIILSLVMLIFAIGTFFLTRLNRVEKKIDNSSRVTPTPNLNPTKSDTAVNPAILDRTGKVITNYDLVIDFKNQHYLQIIEREAIDILKITDEDKLLNLEKYLKSEGYQITTSLDLDLQAQLFTVLDNSPKSLSKTGVVMIDPKTNEIIAMLFDRPKYYIEEEKEEDLTFFSYGHYYGSISKTASYLGLLRGGLQVDFPLPDYSINLGDRRKSPTPYLPQDYSARFQEFGKYVSISKAIQEDLNVPGIAAFQFLGYENLRDTYKKLIGENGKIDDHIDGPSNVNGFGLNFIEQMHVYSTLANNGAYQPQKNILVIKDRNGNVIYKKSNDSKQAIDPKFIYTINQLNMNYLKKNIFTDSDSLNLLQNNDIAGMWGFDGDDRNNNTETVWNKSLITYSPDYVLGVYSEFYCPSTADCMPPANISKNKEVRDKLYKDIYKPMLQKYFEIKSISNYRFTKPEGISIKEICSNFDENKKCINKEEGIYIEEPYEIKVERPEF